jgi:hypothetical protein
LELNEIICEVKDETVNESDVNERKRTRRSLKKLSYLLSVEDHEEDYINLFEEDSINSMNTQGNLLFHFERAPRYNLVQEMEQLINLDAVLQEK